MTVIEAIVLGALQGATEFLPVSSSGHLLLAKALFEASDVPVLFDVLLHVATLVAVCIVFRHRIATLIGAAVRFVIRRSRPEDREHYPMIVVVLVATIITGAIGVGIESLPGARTPLSASVLFLVTAVILIITRWARGTRRSDRVRLLDAVILGAAQGAGVLPGVSRSGITISAGLFAGLDRETAGEVSFVLSLPAILGALVLTLGDAGSLTASVSAPAIVAGFATGLVVGLVSLRLLLVLVRRGGLALFSIYLVPLGVWGIVYFS